MAQTLALLWFNPNVTESLNRNTKWIQPFNLKIYGKQQQEKRVVECNDAQKYTYK